jgi:hypothetical protein
MKTTVFIVLNGIIDLMFFLDVIVNFRTTCFHPRTGNEIVKAKEIAINYLRT